MAKNIKRHITHLKSSGSTLPSSSDILYGEIAVSYGKGTEALFIKNSNNDIVQFDPTADIIGDVGKREITKVTGDSVMNGSTLSDASSSGRTLTINHKTYTARSGFNKLASDTTGHITGATAVTLSDLTGLGAVSSARTITTASGLTGGGNLSANRTIGLVATGTPGTYVKVETDDYGRVTGGTNAISESEVTNLTTDLAGKVSTGRSITAASGLTGGGTLNSDLTIGHSNNITAGSAKTSSSSVTATPSGNNIAIPIIAYDSNGHVTNTGSTNVLLKVNSATTSAAGVVKIATTTGTNNTDTVMTQSAVTKAIEDSFTAQDAMVYKGLVGSGTNNGFPTTFSKGATYKVATAFTANSVSYEIGDMFIANTDVTTAENYTAAHWDAIQTNLDPTLYVNTARTVSGTGALEGGGNLSANREITHKALAPSAVSGKTSPSTAQTPGFNSTFNVPVIDYDKYGHITAVTTTTVKIPNSASTWNQNYYISGATTATAVSEFSVSLNGNNAAAKASFTIPSATTSAAGVMTSADKTALNNLNPLSGKVSTLSAITASSTAINSLTGSVGTMAFQNTSNYYTKDDLTGSSAVAVAKANSASTAASVNSVPLSSVTNADDLKAIEALTGTSGLLKKTDANTWSLDTTSYANQNAYSNIKVGSTTVAAASTTDTVEFSGGTAISIVGTNGTAGNDKITFDLGDIECGDYA